MTKTFVLLHGAWHGGWCWARVADRLRARGHRVTTPTQTGVGERRHLISADLTLQTYIDDLVNHVLLEDLTDAVLVGHSFGGNALSGAAEAIPDRIAELVYLDCTIMAAGERLADKLAPGVLADRIHAAAKDGGDIAVPPPPISAFGVTDPADVAWAEPRLTPHPISTMLSPLPIKGPPGAGLNARYIACTDPEYHEPARVRGWAQTYGWPVAEIATGHDAMVTAPEALSDMLDR
ncbi:MAG: alpha/beta hydrolase family protein [Pseudomonadota bacterium]